MTEGNEAELNKLAGERATVKGTLSGETLTVASVAPAAKTGIEGLTIEPIRRTQ